MEKIDELTSERLRDLYVYCARTGHFYPRRRRPKTKLGEPAGTVARNGYICIFIDGKVYRAHRLAWLYMNDEWPKDDIDHINGNPSDNRWWNLRDVPAVMNNQNTVRLRKNNTSGFTGVVASGKKWCALLRVNGVKKRCGTYDTPEEAYEVYLSMKALKQPGYVPRLNA